MLNKWIGIGRVGKDPEIKTMQSGDKVANFSLATSERWRDKSTGEKREKTEWVNIVVFNSGLVGVIERYVRKGSKLYIEGQLKTRKWQNKEGQDRYTTEVVLQKFNGTLVMLDDRESRPTEHEQAKADGYQPQDDGLESEIPFD